MRTAFASFIPVAAALALTACGDNSGDGDPIDARPIDAPAIDADIDAPIDGPDIDAPIDAPDIDAPDIDAPIDAPDIDAPIDAPDIDAPIDAPDIDAPDIDAPDIDAPTPPAVGTHLLITEVKTVDNSEFVEIYNPTDQTIQLRNYYLTDHQSYFLVPAVAAGTMQPAMDGSDFLARFPMGATIAPRQVITVATDAVGFETAFTSVPTYAVQEPGNSTAMQLVWTFTTGVDNPGLTNGGEMVALFFWDGTSDLVQDVDLVIGGNAPSAANTFIAKTAVDGPDADTNATAYATDALTIQDMQTDTPNGMSYKRILFETLQETQAGTGNGITGDDETSEQSRTTWDSQAVATGYTAGTPGTVPVILNP